MSEETTIKHEDITKIFPDATAEQVGSILNLFCQNNKEVFERLKKAQENITELEKRPSLEDIQNEKSRADNLLKEYEALKGVYELQLVREKVASEKSIPIDLLTGDTEDAINARAAALIEYKSNFVRADIKDAEKCPRNYKTINLNLRSN